MIAYNRTLGRVLAARVLRADTAFARAKGLLGHDALEPGEGMWIAPCAVIHTFFMRFAIDAVFLDGDGRVSWIVENLRPWRLSPWVPGARSVLELAALSLQGGAGRGDYIEFK